MDIIEIVENFGVFDNWEDKYAYLIDLGKKLPVTDDNFKTEQNEVKGCVSKVWLTIKKDDRGCIELKADSDAQIVRGLVAIVISAFNGKSLSEAKNVDIKEIFISTGLDEHLTPNRRNGFYSIIEKVDKFIKANI